MKEKSETAGLRLTVKKKKKLRSWHLAPLLHGKWGGAGAGGQGVKNNNSIWAQRNSFQSRKDSKFLNFS